MSSNKNVVDLRKKKVGGWHKKMFTFPTAPKEKRVSLRARRRRTRLLIAGAGLCVALIVAGVMSYLSYLPRFNVRTVYVMGATHAAPRDIEAFIFEAIYDDSWHFFSPSNIFWYGPGRLEEGIGEDFPRVKQASVGRESMFATALMVKIEERQPFAKWCRDGRIETAASSSTPQTCFVLDDTGFIFATHQKGTTATSYVFFGGVASSTPEADPIGLTFAPSHMQDMLSLMRLFERSGHAPLGARVEGGDDFFVPLQSGFYIKTSFGMGAEMAARNLELVLASERLQGKEEQLEYIDLRFGNKVYFKLKGEAESE